MVRLFYWDFKMKNSGLNIHKLKFFDQAQKKSIKLRIITAFAFKHLANNNLRFPYLFIIFYAYPQSFLIQKRKKADFICCF